MPQISLTDLVDIVSRSGTPKATKVAEIKSRPAYTPAFDFYKPLREEIVAIHRDGRDKQALATFYSGITDQKKRSNYPPAIQGYRKWWGKKNLQWVEPTKSLYSNQGIDVSINPELGLKIDGVPHCVKLYFKGDALSKLRIELVTVLMEIALRPHCKHNEVMAVLDVRNSKLFTLTTATGPIKAVIDAELAYVATLWPNL
ncbi:MAG: hypothetical protein QM776_16870 [Rhodocyclaceae bacterium]